MGDTVGDAQSRSQSCDVVVVGSVNADHIVSLERLPREGETVRAVSHAMGVGGKGANQAISAARVGASVAMVGLVGDDSAGRHARELLDAECVDTTRLGEVTGATASAIVLVDSRGNNSIVVTDGANGMLSPGDAGVRNLPAARVLLCQMEIPAATVATAMQSFRGVVVLNPAPSAQARPLLHLADVIVPNANELADLAGSHTIPSDPRDVVDLAAATGAHGAVVTTLGSRGAVVVHGGHAWHVEAPAVDVVDTTGAGDALCGVLAARLARGDGLLSATVWGVAAGSVAVTAPGAASAMPSLEQIERLLPAVRVTRLEDRDQAVGIPPGFVWGAATSAYQVEGSLSVGGRVESIWDRFATKPGAIAGGADGEPGAQSLENWRDDLSLLKGLGAGAYRFSIAWPRLVEPADVAQGLSYYDRLVDALLAEGIAPYATLYHWDLPQALEDAGGWASRTTVTRFGEHVSRVVDRLGDRVGHWLTVNEPFESAMRGYAQGKHAPGRRDHGDALRASHHLLLAHAVALDLIRGRRPGSQAGIVLNLYPVRPAGEGESDADVARRVDLIQNRLFLDALFRGAYDDEALALMDRLGADDVVLDGDLAAISRPMDYLGVNYYTSYAVTSSGVPGAAPTAYVGAEDAVIVPSTRVTDMGLDIAPEGLRTMLLRLRRDYAPPPILITENGASFHDLVNPEGQIEDFRRVSFLHGHLTALRAALRDGVDVRGYFVWSLVDNFEWSDGYSEKFGIVRHDLTSGRRAPKASYRWYRDWIARHSEGPHGD